MRPSPRTAQGQRGIALTELAIAITVFLVVLFGVIEMARLMWTVNALTDATRRGARYAVVNASGSTEAVQNMVLYASTEAGTTPVVTGLGPDNVSVVYSDDFGLGTGQVTVSITNFSFQFIIPLIGTSVSLPSFTTTLTGESAGVTPPTGTATPTPDPNASPTPTPDPNASPTPTPDPNASPTPTPTPTATPTPDPTATPTPTPTPTPAPTATPTPTPTPSPTPLPNCASGTRPGSPATCVCQPPMVIKSNGKCE